ncbi:anaphase-promoting complex subunit Apc8 [Acrasis kona]|uniref:Anaphase-promoting complex subunit Apc8 n=1 Tax=Acrasis kona TaxID=1008807 RepID=A0AAW2YZC6_9EUKA
MEEVFDDQDWILFDHYTFSKSLFDLKEYLRCAELLKVPLSTHTKHSNTYKKALFLRYYSLYLAGEKRKEQDRAESTAVISNNNQQTKTVQSQKHILNAQLRDLNVELKAASAKDAYLIYLHGVVQKESGEKNAALESFIQSVNLQPLLWCSWLEIVSLMTHSLQAGFYNDERYDEQQQKYNYQQLLDKIKTCIKPHWMNEIFYSHVHVETLSSQGGICNPTLKDNQNTLDKLKEIQTQILPRSSYIITQTAIAYYHLQDYPQAIDHFEHLRRVDPYRIENLDIYSNILYVKELKPQLSLLAHEIQKIDKYRPETSCIIGNYYSSRTEHEKAVLYFQRAVRIDPMYLSAWTLMGHEYIELKNTTAAVNAYRTAVDIHPRDYRAWYGLGQTYELLNLPHYALYYYGKSCTLRPYDGRMWCALAGCYEQLEQYHDALRCYQRARENEDKAHALLKMADLHKKIGQNQQAVALYLKCLDLLETEPERNNNKKGMLMREVMSDDMQAVALLFIARYFQKEVQPPNFSEAKKFCMKVMEKFTGPFKSQAAQMLREMTVSSNLFGNNLSMMRSPEPNTGGSMSFMM